MSLQLRFTQIALVACFVVSAWGTIGMMESNGSADFIRNIRGSKAPILPNTSAPVKTHYTGIGPIDKQLTLLGVFFWSVFDRDHPEYALHLNDFAFQFAVQYGLCVIEGSRPGNAGRLISYTAIWGAFFQNIAVANTLPILFLTYLATSPTVHGASLSTILPSTAQLVSLPISLVLGYFLPTAAISASMAVGDPSSGYETQQNWIAIWQFFPLWVAIGQQILPPIIAPFVEKGNASENVNENVEYLRTAYTVLKYLSTFGHIASYSLSLRTLESPTWFAAGIPDALHYWKVWGPLSISPEFKVADLGTGANLFLQYDRIMSSTAIIIWSYYMYSQTNVKKDSGLFANVWSVLKTAISAAAIGPAGAAVALMEARDEAVLAQAGAGRKKVI